MKTYKIKPEFLSAWGSETTEDTTVTDAEIERQSREWGVSVDELMEQVEEAEPIVLKISKIDFKTETFCTPWNGKLYCVDIFEDAEERSAWLYNVSYGVKSLMFGEAIDESRRDEFLDLVFSNLPSYIEDYEEEYED